MVLTLNSQTTDTCDGFQLLLLLTFCLFAPAVQQSLKPISMKRCILKEFILLAQHNFESSDLI